MGPVTWGCVNGFIVERSEGQWGKGNKKEKIVYVSVEVNVYTLDSEEYELNSVVLYTSISVCWLTTELEPKGSSATHSGLACSAPAESLP